MKEAGSVSPTSTCTLCQILGIFSKRRVVDIVNVVFPVLVAGQITVVCRRSKEATFFIIFIMFFVVCLFLHIGGVLCIGSADDDVVWVVAFQRKHEMELRPNACLRILVVATAPVSADAAAVNIYLHKVFANQLCVADHALRHHCGAVITSSVQCKEALLHTDDVFSLTIELDNRVLRCIIFVGNVDVHIGIHGCALCRRYGSVFKVIDNALHPGRP